MVANYPELDIETQKMLFQSFLKLQSYIDSSTNYNNEDMKTTQGPIERGMDKTTVVHILYGILLCHEKRILSFATKWSQPEKHWAQ